MVLLHFHWKENKKRFSYVLSKVRVMYSYTAAIDVRREESLEKKVPCVVSGYGNLTRYRIEKCVSMYPKID